MANTIDPSWSWPASNDEDEDDVHHEPADGGDDSGVIIHHASIPYGDGGDNLDENRPLLGQVSCMALVA